jgi:methylglyoxal synthase
LRQGGRLMPLTLALIAHDKMKPVLADWAA